MRRAPLFAAGRVKCAYAFFLGTGKDDLRLVRQELQAIARMLGTIDHTIMICHEGIGALTHFWEESMPLNTRPVDAKSQVFPGFMIVDGVQYQLGWERLYADLPTTPREMPTTEACVLRILACLRRNADLHEIIRALKADPVVHFRLFRYLTTAKFLALRHCRTFEQLVMHIGYRELEKWTTTFLLLSAMIHTMPDMHRTALVRARQMEVLAQTERLSKDMCDTAFMVGVLSMMPALLCVTTESVVSNLLPDDPIVQALLHDEGIIARYLAFAIASEKATCEGIYKAFDALSVTATEANQAMLQGIQFADDPYRE